MKNKYTFWLILLAILSSSLAFSQTNPTNMVGAWQQKDTVGGKVVQFRNSSTSLGVTKVVTPATLRDSLKNYAQIQDGLISGGTPTTNRDSLIVASGVVRINRINYNFTGRTFADIPPSSVGLTRILIVYANTSGLLDSISGARSNNPVEPTLPVNTQRIVTVQVNDAGLGIPILDLSGKADLVGDNNFTGNQFITGNIIYTNEGFGTQINPGGWLSTFLIKKGFDSLRGDFTKIGITGGPDYSSLGIWMYEDGKTGYKKSNPNYSHDFNGSINTNSNYLKNGTNLLAGSNGYIPKFNSDSTVSNSIAYTTGNSFLINSTTPAYANTGRTNFEINGSSQALFGLTISGIQKGYFYHEGTNFFFSNDASGDMVFNTNAIERLRLSSSGLSTFSSTVRANSIGLGIAPSANHYLTTAANTSTIGSWLWTPSSTDYTGTVSGTFYNNANELKFYDGTISATNRLVKSSGNALFVGTGVRALTSNNVGDIAATTPIVQQFVTDSDIITAITGATYVSNRATITPAGGKTFLQGQLYDDGTFTYIAISNNSVRRW